MDEICKKISIKKNGQYIDFTTIKDITEISFDLISGDYYKL